MKRHRLIRVIIYFPIIGLVCKFGIVKVSRFDGAEYCHIGNCWAPRVHLCQRCVMEKKSTRDAYESWKKLRHADGVKDDAIWINADYLVRKESSAETEAWFVEVVRNDDTMTIFITNLVQLWCEELTESDFKIKVKALNPNLEGDYRLFAEFVVAILSNQAPCSKIIVDFGAGEDCYLKINLLASYEDVPFHWEFDGTLCSPQKTRKIVVDPLLSCISQYQRREKFLIDLIHQKDREILHYSSRMEKSCESTTKFSATDFQKSDQNSDEFFDLGKRQKLDIGFCFQDTKFNSMVSEIRAIDRFLEDFHPVEENDLKVLECLPQKVEQSLVKEALKREEISESSALDERPPPKKKQILRL